MKTYLLTLFTARVSKDGRACAADIINYGFAAKVIYYCKVQVLRQG
ncbi:MAG: hypothetical protein JST82_10255 [Bacteroidetes bacterium]|nr:hypothetical protein [Bacteroidota bacterium]